jgi:electron transfer flavoprotein alpha subunit
VEAVLLGHGVRPIAEEAFRYGASRVYLLDDPVLAIYRNLPYAVAVSRLAQTYAPEILLIGATTRGRDLASAIATRLETGLTADCTELAIDPKLGILAATRPTFGGNLMATILCRKHRPQMATVRPRVLPMPLPLADASGEILPVEPGLCEADIPVRRLRLIPSEERLNLEHAEVIVAGGRGSAVRTACRCSGGLPTCWAASSPSRDRWWTRAGSRPITRSGRPARRCGPSSILPPGSPAPCSIGSAWATRTSSSRSIGIPRRPSSGSPISGSSATSTR